MYQLIRFFANHERARQFLHGQIYMSPLSYFWNVYHNNNQQKDIFEGVGFSASKDASFLRGADLAPYIAYDIKYRVEAYKYCNLCCFFRVDINEDTKKIHYPSNSMIQDFGDYAAIIMDNDQLIARVLGYARANNFDCICGDVNYHAVKDNSDPNKRINHSLEFCAKEAIDIQFFIQNSNITEHYDCFDKAKKFRNQREWRICLLRDGKKEDAHIMDLGDMSSIVRILPAREIVNALHRMYPECHYSCLKQPAPNYLGTISRDELKKRLLTIDRGAKLMFSIG